MNNFSSVLRYLEQEQRRLSSQLDQIGAAINALSNNAGRRDRKISAAGRGRIAAAQRARWAKAKRQKVVSISSRKRPKMSAAAIARIRAAQKARWAKWRKEQKKTA
jgi:hypothetical protein